MDKAETFDVLKKNRRYKEVTSLTLKALKHIEEKLRSGDCQDRMSLLTIGGLSKLDSSDRMIDDASILCEACIIKAMGSPEYKERLHQIREGKINWENSLQTLIAMDPTTPELIDIVMRAKDIILDERRMSSHRYHEMVNNIGEYTGPKA